MTYRDDHDAAIARGDALERELDATEAELEKAKTDRARLEAEVAELRAKQPSPAVSSDDDQLVNWSATLNDNEDPSDWHSDRDPPDHRLDWLAWAIPLGGLLFVLVIILVLWATG